MEPKAGKTVKTANNFSGDTVVGLRQIHKTREHDNQTSNLRNRLARGRI